MKDRKITIVGAGLVGSLAACYFARRGYNVIVVEGRPDLRAGGLSGGRSINLALSTRGLRALEDISLADTIRAQAVPMNGRMMHDREGQLSFQPYGEEGQFINSISRSALNKVLITEASRLGVDFRFEHRCKRVNLLQSEVTVTNAGHDHVIESEIIIGADGMHSIVRSAMQHTDRFNYSQDYIEDGYKELTIHPQLAIGAKLEKQALHIWPRGRFMLIALPNPDYSFTCTLFLPFEGDVSFANLRDAESVTRFFKSYFRDIVPLMPSLTEDFLANPASSLVTVHCYPWVVNNALLLGDAAHGIVPFYGQGMNAGFEDCRILNQLLDVHHDNWSAATKAFQEHRKPDADAIATLALDNFIEMRDHVANPEFLLRKKIEARLHELYPDRWIPLYSMVTFDDHIRYSDAYSVGTRQKRIMDLVMQTPDIHSVWTSLDFEAIVEQLSQ